MSIISFSQKGNFSELISHLKPMSQIVQIKNAELYAQKGLEALMAATPKRTGLTASSWTYHITRTDTSLTISYDNTNVQKGIHIAVILDTGHYSRGHWIEGRHYIDPAIRPVFDEIANDLWEEIKSV